MNKKLTYSILIIFLALSLVGCQVAQAATATSSQPPAGTMTAAMNRPQAAAATATASPTAKPTAAPTATAVPVMASAEAAAKTYFAALQKKDFTAAAQVLSIFGLSSASLTRTTAATQLNELSVAGVSWSDFQIVDSQVFNESTILVHVRYKATASASTAAGAAAAPVATATAAAVKDELWPFRKEGSAWLYNWNNLIDIKTVDVTQQTWQHITVKPTYLARYSDRLEMHLMLLNQNEDVVYFTQDYDSLAVFHFDTQAVEADKTHKIVVSGLRTAYDEVITVKGLYTSFPNWVEVKKWSGYYVNPWYSFKF